jgi:hypothetical protein
MDQPAPRRPRPPLIYVSGPLTTGNAIVNIRAALDVGWLLRERGYAVIVPHDHLLAELVHPVSYAASLAYDFRLIRCCDAVYRMPGASVGADAEVEFALRQRIPVYWSLDTLCAEQRVPEDRP